ncbi:hypothetical protein J2848_006757 [Azospirillum lipoferum]|uniref:Uncharacterized protein n=1 Tax=Azospirillum lipoferum TaxID=193 RepID=A0A5A9GIM0_AZOLI|nr:MULTISPECIES: hypothetical protein [Azospirillum]KAA0593695.1 hypothetical protein FZ942_22640 [Azospirillum lipoferum]MCP1615044.1 hypothetical protein [Azospirillum lipoferum]MDW5536949.1 hypothetical protein [Azospirillum sp. NL1]
MPTVHVFASGPRLKDGQTVTVASCRSSQIAEALLAVKLDATMSAPPAASERDASRWDGAGEMQTAVLRDHRPGAAVWLTPEQFALPPHALPLVRKFCDVAGMDAVGGGLDAARAAWKRAEAAGGFILDAAQADLAHAVLPTGTPLLHLPADCPAALRMDRAAKPRTVLVMGDLALLAPQAQAFGTLTGALMQAGLSVALVHLPFRSATQPPDLLPAHTQVLAAPVPETLRQLLREAAVTIDPFHTCGEPYLATAMRHAICARNSIGLMSWTGEEDSASILRDLTARQVALSIPQKPSDGVPALRALTKPPPGRPAALSAGPDMGSVLLVAGGEAGRRRVDALLPLFASLIRRGRLDGLTVVQEAAEIETPAVERYGKPSSGNLYDAVLVCGIPSRSMMEAILLTTERRGLHLEGTAGGTGSALRRLMGGQTTLCASFPGLLNRMDPGRQGILLPPALDLLGAAPAPAGRPVAMVMDATAGLPLATSKGPVLTAIAKASARYGLPLLWFGTPDPDFFRFIPDIRIQAATTRPAILNSLLQCGPLIALAPVDDGVECDGTLPGDERMMLFGASGHRGIYSACSAHAASTLPAGLLVQNSETAWLDAIGRLHGATDMVGLPDVEAIRTERSTDRIADLCLLALLTRIGLPTPASLDGVLTYRQIHREAGRRLPFDEEAYLTANPDVRGAVLAGHFPDGYSHFVQYGMAEGRMPDYAPRDDPSFSELAEQEIAAGRRRMAEAQRLIMDVVGRLQQEENGDGGGSGN